MKISITRGLESTKEYGMISRLIMPDGGKIYITKKGWNLVTPPKTKEELQRILNRINKIGRIEINIPYNEINATIQETLHQGYGIKKVKQ